MERRPYTIEKSSNDIRDLKKWLSVKKIDMEIIPGPKIAPNIAGHETGTWENAHEIAKEIAPQTGIDAAGYKKMAEKESPKKIIVASR